MAPIRPAKGNQENQTKAICTRTRTTITNITARPKRKADFSPQRLNVKRTVLEDLTNDKNIAVNKKTTTVKQTIKKTVVKSKTLAPVRTVLKPKHNENVPPAPCVNGVATRAATKNAGGNQTALKPKQSSNVTRVKTRLSNHFENSEESLYSSALEELDSAPPSGTKCKNEDKTSEAESSNEANVSIMSQVAHQLQDKLNLGNHDVPEGVNDFDRENWDDTFQVSHYAMDIFNYLKSREAMFQLDDYMVRQVCLTTWMRSLLIDWMVEVQESFELNHETLYLGVKLVDLYLSKMNVTKEVLQLVGAASMFIASKYDERIPPAIDDFLYICDGAYTKRELIRMEIQILEISDFNLGIPLSYRFLRRYARCAKLTMPVLTLARFILEYSLMDYATVTVRDSKLASAALYLAMRMKKVSSWTPTLEFYAGYKLQEIMDVVLLLNDGLHKKTKTPLMTVRNKYSHKIFFEVAKTPLLKNEELLLLV